MVVSPLASFFNVAIRLEPFPLYDVYNVRFLFPNKSTKNNGVVWQIHSLNTGLDVPLRVTKLRDINILR